MYFLSSNVVHLFFASVAYGIGFVAVVVVSLVSLIGVLTVPVAGKKIMRYLSAFLVAMGISALASDAVLHLIPHVSTPHSMYTCQVWISKFPLYNGRYSSSCSVCAVDMSSLRCISQALSRRTLGEPQN